MHDVSNCDAQSSLPPSVGSTYLNMHPKCLQTVDLLEHLEHHHYHHHHHHHHHHHPHSDLKTLLSRKQSLLQDTVFWFLECHFLPRFFPKGDPPLTGRLQLLHQGLGHLWQAALRGAVGHVARGAAALHLSDS